MEQLHSSVYRPEETSDINELRDQVSTAIYNSYKPSTDPDQHFTDKSNRDKSKGTISEENALLKAKRLNHWAETATVSAERIYAELQAAMDLAEEMNVGGDDVLMGEDTDIEPDVVINDTTALEVKHVNSPSQGAVDEHVKKGSQQLDKREWNKNINPNKKITNWKLTIMIKNENNPWPFTPTKLNQLIKKKKAIDVKNEGKERINKYEDCAKNVGYSINSDNANIGNFIVDT